MNPLPPTSNLFKLYDKNPVKQCSNYRNATEGLWDETILSKAYFSRENMQIIQNAIRRGVYEKSNQNYIIDNQSCDDLKIIMRSIFLQNSVNNGNIQKQILALNASVVEWCIEKIYSEAIGYLRYLYDASTLVVPIDRPVLVNHLNKNLEFKGWF